MTKRKPLWVAVNDEALRPENLARALGSMGLPLYCGSVPRGSITWWQPEYLRAPTAAMAASFFPQRDTAIRDESIAAYVARRRAVLADVNRHQRDADVVLFAIETAGAKHPRPAGRILAVCTYQGEWTTTDRANRGADLISLGAWRWSLSYGKAAAKLARCIGLNNVPTVEEAA